jgi:hypothetical protein
MVIHQILVDRNRVAPAAQAPPDLTLIVEAGS